MWVYIMKSQKIETNVISEHKTAPSLTEREMIANAETADLQQVSVEKQGDRQITPIKQEEPNTALLAATGGLAVMLGQLVAYFNNRAHIDDLDVLSFSLHHLFCRVDFLYNTTLPALATWTKSLQAGQTGHPPHLAHPAYRQQDVRQRQQVWTQLQAINRTLDRMEPLCHLLSDAAECVLERFDLSSDILGFAESGKPPASPRSELEHDDQQDWVQIIDMERWEQAFTAIAQTLFSWQEQHSMLPSFAAQFAHLLPTAPTLPELDAAFATILDSAGAIYGDILPGFRAILSADEAMIAALLYDLMQQSDQLLMKFDTTLEPMNTLIKHYAIGSELS